jgi:antitoxin CptB|tara:strand:- start:93 stop:359 length:267 start_codon:yes stop_codon:yes gene_type:complete
MNINTDVLKKKIIYRSIYRGTKEMDMLLGSFVKKYINILKDKELIYLSDLLKVDDENLYKFNQGQKMHIEIEINNVTELFRNFVYKVN